MPGWFLGCTYSCKQEAWCGTAEKKLALASDTSSASGLVPSAYYGGAVLPAAPPLDHFVLGLVQQPDGSHRWQRVADDEARAEKTRLLLPGFTSEADADYVLTLLNTAPGGADVNLYGDIRKDEFRENWRNAKKSPKTPSLLEAPNAPSNEPRMTSCAPMADQGRSYQLKKPFSVWNQGAIAPQRPYVNLDRTELLQNQKRDLYFPFVGGSG